MAKTILVTGGSRSGKSRIAEELVLRHPAPLGYCATSRAGDDEMRERILRHQSRRGTDWQTFEEEIAVCDLLQCQDGRCNAILLDCITLWITNLLFSHNEQSEPVLAEVRRLTELFPSLATPLVIVTSEVGMGIVPENRLGRQFRDLAGEANQIIAAAADEVWLAVSGIPLKVK